MSATNVVRAGKRGNICVGNNVSATMCPRLPGPYVLRLSVEKGATKFGQQILTSKSRFCHEKLAPFPVATCRSLTS